MTSSARAVPATGEPQHIEACIVGNIEEGLRARSIVLALALLLMVLPAVIGSFLGDVYQGSAVRRFESSPEEVWAAVGDYPAHPLHGQNVKGVQELDSANGLPAWEEILAHSTALISTLEQDEPRLVKRRSENLEDTLTLEWTCTIAPVDTGSEVTVEQRIVVTSGGWFGANLRFMMNFLGEADRGAARYLERLEPSLEGGSSQ